jgi:hypothetical protein
MPSKKELQVFKMLKAILDFKNSVYSYNEAKKMEL